MSDVFERLSVADPYAGNAFELPDVASFMTRVSRPPRRISTWRRFQLSVSGAISATTLIMVGSIAALQGAAPSLPVLNFALASATQFNVYSSVRASTSHLPTASVHGTDAPGAAANTLYHFIAAPRFSNATSVGPAYQLRAPSNPRTETTRIASIFGVSGALRQLTTSAAWQLSSPGARVTFASQGLWTWGYVNTSTSATNSVVETVPVHELVLKATQLVSGLHYGYQLGIPAVTTGSVAGSGPSNSAQGFVSIHLRFPVVVSGTTTGLVSDFTFSTSGTLLSAHGPAFFVASSYPYPLLSPLAGVARLNAQRNEPVSSAGPSTNSPTLVQVTISNALIALGAYRLSDGTLWLVPVYSFTGMVNAKSTTWSLLALDPRYTKNASLAAPLASQANRN